MLARDLHGWVGQCLPHGPGKNALGGIQAVQVLPSEYPSIITGWWLVHIPEMPLPSSLDAWKVEDASTSELLVNHNSIMELQWYWNTAIHIKYDV